MSACRCQVMRSAGRRATPAITAIISSNRIVTAALERECRLIGSNAASTILKTGRVRSLDGNTPQLVARTHPFGAESILPRRFLSITPMMISTNASSRTMNAWCRVSGTQ